MSIVRLHGNERERREADLRERILVIRELLPKLETRVLLVISTETCGPAEQFEDQLRDHLGHTILFLRSPKAPNECRPDAENEWRASTKRVT